MINFLKKFKVYKASYTNETEKMEAVFEISYLQFTQMPKNVICYTYGPTNLCDKL